MLSNWKRRKAVEVVTEQRAENTRKYFCVWCVFRFVEIAIQPLYISIDLPLILVHCESACFIDDGHNVSTLSVVLPNDETIHSGFWLWDVFVNELEWHCGNWLAYRNDVRHVADRRPFYTDPLPLELLRITIVYVLPHCHGCHVAFLPMCALPIVCSPPVCMPSQVSGSATKPCTPKRVEHNKEHYVFFSLYVQRDFVHGWGFSWAKKWKAMIDCRESGTIERDPCDLTLHAMNRVENLGKESLIHRKMFENM